MVGKRILRVFIDTSVLFPGLLFPGPPRRLLYLARERKIALVVSGLVLSEVKGLLKAIAPSHLEELDTFLVEAKVEWVKHPSRTTIQKYAKFTGHEEDAPILAAAIQAKPDYFVTGDKGFKRKELKPLINIISCSGLLKVAF